MFHLAAGRVTPIIAFLVLATAAVARSANAAPGELDPSFGTGGLVTTNVSSSSDVIRAIALQSDGRIVATGKSSPGDFTLVRYLADGQVDAAFGSGGIARADMGDPYDEAKALAIQADGRIVAAGAAGLGEFAVARFLTDGSLDASFGAGGRVRTDFGAGDAATSVALMADGRIVVAGYSMSPLATNVALARYLPGGTLDPTFDGDGRVTTDFGGDDFCAAVAIQPDGRTVIAGTGGASPHFILARYLADGSLDPTFGTGGRVITEVAFGGWVGGMALQPDGKIVVAGFSGSLKFAVARYLADGTLDPDFGEAGIATTRFEEESYSDDRAYAVALQPDGKILAAGMSYFDYNARFGLVRYRTDGTPDPTFGTGGRVVIRFLPDRSWDVPNAVALQPDGNIVVAGGAGGCLPSCWFALARVLGGPFDEEPPALHVTASPDQLWPPDHSLVEVRVGIEVSDDVDLEPEVQLVGVSVDEPDTGGSRDDVLGDIVQVDERTFLLRAERAGAEDGREYRICYRAVDDVGHETEACAVVQVPHERATRRGPGTSSLASGSLPERLALSARSVANGARIRYDMPTDGRVRIGVFDVAGREVARLLDDRRPAGRHELTWTPTDGRGAQMYFLRLEALGQSLHARCVAAP